MRLSTFCGLRRDQEHPTLYDENLPTKMQGHFIKEPRASYPEESGHRWGKESRLLERRPITHSYKKKGVSSLDRFIAPSTVNCLHKLDSRRFFQQSFLQEINPTKQEEDQG